MRLSDEEFRDVMARAEEIQRTALRGSDMSAELEAVIQAATEVGLSRPAVEQAIRERFNLPAKAPETGDRVFAKSADDKYYVAQVVAAGPDGVRVKFMRGGEHTVTLDQLRACSFLPGERVVCYWPWWGPWTCTILSYDATAGEIKVTDGWGETRKFSIDEVWLNTPRTAEVSTRRKISLTLLGAGAGIGALVGSIVTALLMR